MREDHTLETNTPKGFSERADSAHDLSKDEMTARSVSKQNLASARMSQHYGLFTKAARYCIGDFAHAPETFAFMLPTLALIPSVLYSAWLYARPDLQYTPCLPKNETVVEPPAPAAFNPVTHAFIGSTEVVQPFSTLTNLCYWISGFAILIYALPRGAILHPQMYLLAALFALNGAGSAAMHASGGIVGSWSHAVDILSIYTLFVGLSSTATLGLWCALLGRAHKSSASLDCAGLVSAVIHVLTIAFLAWCVVLWQEIDQRAFLLATGGIVISCNSATRSIFAFRAATLHGHSRLGASSAALLSAMRLAVPQLVVIWCAIYINLVGREEDAAIAKACELASSPALVAARIELVRKRDWIHGAWHFLSSSALLAMALAAQEGLDGPPPATENQLRRTSSSGGIESVGAAPSSVSAGWQLRVQEDISAISSCMYALSIAALFTTGANSAVWMRFLVISSLGALPTRTTLRLLVTYCLSSCFSRHHAPQHAHETNDWQVDETGVPLDELGMQRGDAFDAADNDFECAHSLVHPPTPDERTGLEELRVNILPARARALTGQACGHRRCHSLPVAPERFAESLRFLTKQTNHGHQHQHGHDYEPCSPRVALWHHPHK